MLRVDPQNLDFLLLEDVVWVAAQALGLPRYDFDFATYFACRRPLYRPAPLQAIGRFGATTHYAELYHELAAEGVELIHTPEQYGLTSELTQWYPLLEDLTPRSRWYESPPPVEQVEAEFSWPVFVKGSRQTSRHKLALSILHSPEDYRHAMELYAENPILHWQALVCREFVPLRAVPAPATDSIPPAFEFRTFWWRGHCVGAGPYWAAVIEYAWTEAEKETALAVAEEAARRIPAVFVVVDVAQTREGKWIVIEINDGQESSYAGVAPLPLWQKIIEIERELR